MSHYKAALRLLLGSALLLAMGGSVQAQLTLDISATPDPAQPGELLRYEFAVTNSGSSNANMVSLSSQTSSGTSVVATDGGTCPFNNCAIAGVAVTWTLGTLGPGQSAKRQLITRVAANATAGMMLTNTAKVTASNAAEVDMSRSIPVDPTRALALTIVEAAAPAVPGESLTYIVTFANRSNSADAGVMLQAAVPAGTQFVSATQGGTEQAGVVTWSVGTVGVGQSGERRFTVQVMAEAPEALFGAAERRDAEREGVQRGRWSVAT